MIDFSGTERFQVLRRLGAGGMGVVYEAIDLERNTRVALKTLRTGDGDAILRFKNEFRALQDLTHPNLVSLGELIAEKGEWFFTMELVDGADFLSHVRPGRRVRAEPPTVRPDGETFRWEPRHAPTELPPPRAPLDQRRLRAALGQLALGLHALHAANKVHRDIKPSNILVTRDERVVLLDFGLAKDVVRQTDSDPHVVGTADYMAPEQAASRPVGPEADWYSMGVLLYEALTGRLPFLGAPLEILMLKQRLEPPPPRSHDPSLPADLDELARALLRTDPRARPSGEEILRRLGLRREREGSGPLALPAAPFVGRRDEWRALDEALDDVRRGAAVAVVVEGESGVGKSALVRQFLDGAGDALVLSGRCYERESVPFKAFDGVVDALSRHLIRAGRVDSAEILPPDAELVAQVFPVLWGVEGMADRPRAQKVPTQERRARLFAALRVLLARLAARAPVVVFIDDLQWADADSLSLLAEVMRPPDAPAILLVATARRALEIDRGGDVRRLQLAGLPPDEARALALELFSRYAPDSPDMHDRFAEVARGAHGHPLFIDELVRHVAFGGPDARGPLYLEEALWSRIGRLEPTARRLLELISVAGVPITQDAAAWALAVDVAHFSRWVSSLRTANLVRTGGARGSDRIEPYHDRVRAAVLANIDDETRRHCHERLAAGLEAAAGPKDLEALCIHWLGAGQGARGSRYAAEAAAEAARAFAFARAARLYQVALEWGEFTHEEKRALRIECGDALAAAGHGAEAAALYLRAADGAGAARALDLKRRAASRYLFSGHVDEGLRVLNAVLAEVGLPAPAATPHRALARIVWRRALQQARGMNFRAREASELAPEELARVDVCWSAASGLGIVDQLRGADFGARHLWEALRVGEPSRVSLGLATEACYAACAGGASRRRALALLARARSLAHSLRDPHARGMVQTAASVIATLDGRWRAGRVRADRAAQLFRDHCPGATWEIDQAQIFSIWCLYYLGELDELSARVPKLLREAEERGDRYAATSLRIGFASMYWLMAGDSDGARAEAARALDGWSRAGFQVQHYYALHTAVQADLYDGDGAGAMRRLDARARDTDSFLLLSVEVTRLEHLFLRARAALAAGRLDGAERDARRIARERAPWAQPLAQLIRAGLCARRGDRDEAARLLFSAAAGFDKAEMALHAHVARRRRGALLDGVAGHALTAEADGWMAAEGVADPDRMCDLIAPGF